MSALFRFVSPIVFILLSTCVRAPETYADVPLLQIADRTSAPGYYTLDGQRKLLLGMDLSEEPLDEPGLIAHINALKAARGNLLIVADSLRTTAYFAVQQRRAAKNGVALLTQANSPEVARVSKLTDFHQQLLAGAGGVVYTHAGPSLLNSFRTVQTVEQLVAFSSLEPPADQPEASFTRYSPTGIYLRYMPTTGQVRVTLPDGQQIRRRVTVVGHLGTQRSEILEPPYDPSFTLTSREENGGYLLIAPQE
jgi:hypothetical protein